MGQSKSEQPAPLWFAGMFSSAGLFIVLMAMDVIPVDPETLHPPRWVLAAAGMVFMIGGIMAAVGQRNPLLNDVLAGVLIGCMAMIATWIAFGPGERQFSGGVSLGPVGIGGSSAPSLGRIAFGLSSILLWLLVAYVVQRCVKQIRTVNRPSSY